MKYLNLSSNEKRESIKFDILNSDNQAKYYKLFYYNEESNLWTLNSESAKQLGMDIGIKKNEGLYTSYWSYLDSNEEDLISFNSKFINGSYPKFDNEKEIFVYALIGSSLPNIREKVFSSKKKELSKAPI